MHEDISVLTNVDNPGPDCATVFISYGKHKSVMAFLFEKLVTWHETCGAHVIRLTFFGHNGKSVILDVTYVMVSIAGPLCSGYT